jgi:DNA-binding CsgD family transcriptional regulator
LNAPDPILENYFNFIKGGKDNSDSSPGFNPYLLNIFSDQILDSGNVFYIIIEESTHKVVYCSPRIKNVLGVKAQDTIGGYSYDLHKYATKEDMDYLDELYGQASKVLDTTEGTSLLALRFSLGANFIKPDDHKEIFMLIQIRILNLDKKRKPLFTLLVFTDISLFQTENKPFFHITKLEDSNQNKETALFSKREIEVIKYISRGLTNAQIGDQLNISKETVRNHRSNIFKKAEVKNMAQLILFALSNQSILQLLE